MKTGVADTRMLMAILYRGWSAEALLGRTYDINLSSA